MPSGDVYTEPRHWKPRLTRAALWALLGGLSFLLGWAALYGLGWLGLDVNWGFGPISVGLFLMPGFAFSAALGVAIWRAGVEGWRRAAGFAALAMPWFNIGFVVGDDLYVGKYQGSPWQAWGIPYEFTIPLPWFSGFLVAGIWVTISGLVLLPFLRSRTGIVWILAASTGFAVLAGGAALIINNYMMLNALRYITAAWCALYAAAFSMALPQGRR